MNRRASREQIVTLLVDAGFATVYGSEVRAFDGASPVVTVSSVMLQPEQLARGVVTQRYAHQVTLWIGAEDDLEATEDALDDGMTAIVNTLQAAGYVCDGSTTEPYGAPLNDINGLYYRAERITVRRANYT